MQLILVFEIKQEARKRVLMLLRNRSRAVTKPNLMADHSSQQSSNNQNCTKKTIPSLFGSPKFKDFTNNNNNNSTLFGTDHVLKSPTSILDTRLLSPYGFKNPFFHDKNTTQIIPNKTSWDKKDSRGIGVALFENSFEPNKGNVLFGTQLKVKIPFECQPCSGGDYFGTKTKDSPNIGLIMSLSEMELSEEYTCVISHGANPRTTHIFNNYIVEENYCSLPQNSNSVYENFLRVCYTCKKHLEQTKDIFIYRSVSFTFAL